MPDLQNKNQNSGGQNRSLLRQELIGAGFNRNPQRQESAGGRSRQDAISGRTRQDAIDGRQRDDATSGRQREEIPRPAKGEYKSQWITSDADSALVEYAEKAGRYMARKALTNSKIRSIYGEIKRIQMSDFEKEKSSFILLKPKVAYALGREPNNDGLKLFKEIFDLSSADVTNQKSFQNFCNFMEALLAYHKAYGGKD